MKPTTRKFGLVDHQKQLFITDHFKRNEKTRGMCSISYLVTCLEALRKVKNDMT